jgi:hypothetical protein
MLTNKNNETLTHEPIQLSDICFDEATEKKEKDENLSSAHKVKIAKLKDKDPPKYVYIKFVDDKAYNYYISKIKTSPKTETKEISVNEEDEEEKSLLPMEEKEKPILSADDTKLASLEALFSQIYLLYTDKYAAKTVLLKEGNDIIGTASYSLGTFIPYQKLRDLPNSKHINSETGLTYGNLREMLFRSDASGNLCAFKITEGLASILMASRLFAENDLHARNFGFVIPPDGTIKNGYWARFDYGESFAENLEGKYYSISDDDLKNLPAISNANSNIPKSNPRFTPGQRNYFTSLDMEYNNNITDLILFLKNISLNRENCFTDSDHNLFASLANNEEFKTEKNTFLCRLALIPKTLVTYFIEQSGNINIKDKTKLSDEFIYRVFYLKWIALCNQEFQSYIKKLGSVKKNDLFKKIENKIKPICKDGKHLSKDEKTIYDSVGNVDNINSRFNNVYNKILSSDQNKCEIFLFPIEDAKDIFTEKDSSSSKRKFYEQLINFTTSIKSSFTNENLEEASGLKKIVFLIREIILHSLKLDETRDSDEEIFAKAKDILSEETNNDFNAIIEILEKVYLKIAPKEATENYFSKVTLFWALFNLLTFSMGSTIIEILVFNCVLKILIGFIYSFIDSPKKIIRHFIDVPIKSLLSVFSKPKPIESLLQFSISVGSFLYLANTLSWFSVPFINILNAMVISYLGIPLMLGCLLGSFILLTSLFVYEYQLRTKEASSYLALKIGVTSLALSSLAIISLLLYLGIIATNPASLIIIAISLVSILSINSINLKKECKNITYFFNTQPKDIGNNKEGHAAEYEAKMNETTTQSLDNYFSKDGIVLSPLTGRETMKLSKQAAEQLRNSLENEPSQETQPLYEHIDNTAHPSQGTDQIKP